MSAGPTGCSETSIRNYHCLLCNNPEERSAYILRGNPEITQVPSVFVQASILTR